MRVDAVAVREVGDLVRLSGVVDGQELYFELPAGWAPFVSDRGDAFVAACLLPAMAGGEPLHVEAPVSPALLDGVRAVQEVFAAWYPNRFHPVEVTAGAVVAAPRADREAVAQFFSLGVDSFHTLLDGIRSGRPSTHVLYTRGLEVPLPEYDDGRGAAVAAQISAVAGAYGAEIIEVRTNLRQLFALDWAREYSGSGLAAVALSLQAGLPEVRIPSGQSYVAMRPAGTSPLVDPRYSTEAQRIVVYGCDVDRAEKIAAISDDQRVLDNLRVCLSNRGGEGNCGRCQKCVRTMTALHILGRLDGARAFPEPLPRRLDRLLPYAPGYAAAEMAANIALAERCGVSDRVVRALRRRHVMAAVYRVDAGPLAIVGALARLLLRRTVRRA